jgi:hypothetical protein
MFLKTSLNSISLAHIWKDVLYLLFVNTPTEVNTVQARRRMKGMRDTLM